VGEQLADAARRLRVDVRGRRAVAGAKHARGLLAWRGPQRAHRDVERAGDPLDRRHARPREPTLELAEERMRQPGLAAEALEREATVTPKLPDAGTQHDDRVGGWLLTVA